MAVPRNTPAASTAPTSDGTDVVRWPDPSPLQDWWTSVMGTDPTADPARPAA